MFVVMVTVTITITVAVAGLFVVAVSVRVRKVHTDQVTVAVKLANILTVTVMGSITVMVKAADTITHLEFNREYGSRQS